MKMIVTIIPINLVTNLLFNLFLVFHGNQKQESNISASCRSGKEKYFCFFFIASRVLLQKHVEFSRLL